jgi:acyl-CoA reductase-like NAD-dependent aldehyde dehydrogenase
VTQTPVERDLAQPRMLIGGEWVTAASGATLDVVDPAHGTVIARVPAADRADVDRAVATAKEAFRSGVWSERPNAERAKVLHRFADTIERRIDELYRLETLNNGRPISETRAQVGRLPEWYRYNAALLLADRTAVVPMPGPYHSYTQRFPVGVVGILSSFNHPLMIGSKSLAPALATGNSVVLKPSEQTPLTTLKLGEIATESGFPDGVLNIINGLGPVAGAALCEHPDVAKVTFTGGTEPGRAVAVAAARHFARATVELGGKSPVLVFDDSPVEVTAKGAAFAGFIAAGQTCIAGTRLMVQRSIHDDFVAALVDQARRIRVGDPADPETQIGPVISARARDRILEYVAVGRQEGATVATGGGSPDVPGCEGGWFIEPTVLVDVTNDMRVSREEIFGPVVVVIPFDDEDEAVALANDSAYGLGSGIWTANVARAHRVASRLEHGIVWVNDHHRLDPASPWGGVRDSGMGREGGWESFHEFSHVRAVTIRTAPVPVDWYGGDLDRLN